MTTATRYYETVHNYEHDYEAGGPVTKYRIRCITRMDGFPDHLCYVAEFNSLEYAEAWAYETAWSDPIGRLLPQQDKRAAPIT